MSTQIQPPVPLVKTESLTLIKNEPPEEALEEEISPNKKDDTVYHPLCEVLIKSETVVENILETKHSESVETQVLVKPENSVFIKTENIIQSIKIEDTSDENVTRGTGQEAVELQDEHSNTLSNLETDEQFVLNFSKDLIGIGIRNRKAKQSEKTNLATCYKKTVETTSWEKDKEKIKVIEAPVIPVEPQEYTSLAKDKHVCNHCKYTCNRLDNLKLHIKRMHREVTTMHQCPYCPYKSYNSLCRHIIVNHKSAKDIEWFQCHLCEKKFKLKYYLTEHIKIHLTHVLCLVCGKRFTHKKGEKRYCSEKCLKKRQIKYHCDKCNYKTHYPQNLNDHKLTHLKPKEIEYFYCFHCSHKSKLKMNLKKHIFGHFRNENVPFHCYICDFVTPKRDFIIKHIRKHFKNRNKYDETIKKYQAETRFRKLEKRYSCDKCNYKTCSRRNLTRHKFTHLKPEDIEYFYCYHCSHKNKDKQDLKRHILRHFRNENVPFHCYICDFMTGKRDLIVEHLKRHSKHHSKLDDKRTININLKRENRHSQELTYLNSR